MYLIQVAGEPIDLEQLVFFTNGVLEKDGKFYIEYEYGDVKEPLVKTRNTISYETKDEAEKDLDFIRGSKMLYEAVRRVERIKEQEAKFEKMVNECHENRIKLRVLIVGLCLMVGLNAIALFIR